MPDFGSSANPCDITAASLHDKTMYGHCITAFANDPSFAAVVVPMFSVFAPSTVERARYLCEVAAGLSKPVCIVWLNEWLQGPGSEVYEHTRALTMFRSMKRCLGTLKAWLTYHERRDALIGRETSRVSGAASVDAARALLGRQKAGATLSEGASKALLASYGIPVTRQALVLSEDDAVRAAQTIGYPVVLKAESDAIPHKTESGVVHLSLADEAAVRGAYRAIKAAVAQLAGAPAISGVSVQEMVSGGVEVMAGINNDAQFGPVLVVGMGGVQVEILRDTAVALAPVSPAEALIMLQSLKGYRLLAGYRGAKPVALVALADTIARLSELATDHRERLAEVDVNPIVALANRVVAVDALVVSAGKKEG
jgi:acyl-CoA synthetase (NDP forming)